MLLVECTPDEFLIRSLTRASRKNIQHSANKFELLKTITERHVNSKGIIDEDPGSNQPPQMQKFKEKQSLTKYGIRILYQTSKNNTLIVLCPKLEDWILESAKEASIKPEKYNLPSDPARLHRQINIHPGKFQKMVEKLKTDSSRIKKLEEHLTTER